MLNIFGVYLTIINEDNKRGMQQVVNKFLVRLHKFMKSDVRNEWIILYELQIYVRKSKRYHNKRTINCLDLASIEVHKKGVGLFTLVLKGVLRQHKNIFIESILEKRFYNFLLKPEFGFKKYATENCLIRINKN